MRLYRNSRFAWLTRCFCLCLCCLLAVSPLLSSLAHAQAKPYGNLTYHPAVNRTVAGIVTDNLRNRGYAANDPRVAGTLRGMATGAGRWLFGGIRWPQLVVAAGVFHVVDRALDVGTNSLVRWLYNDDGTISIMGLPAGTDISQLPLIPNSYILILDQIGAPAEMYYRQADNTVRWIRTLGFPCPAEGICEAPDPFKSHLDHTFTMAYPGPYPGEHGYWQNAYRRIIGGQYQVLFNFLTAHGEVIIPSAPNAEYLTPEEAMDMIPEDIYNEQLSPEMLAALGNSLWQAADPYGIPWSATNPITANDVNNWIAQNSEYAPAVADFLRPVAPPGATEVPFPLPDGTPSTPTTPGTGTEVNLGEDPNTPPPELEPIPTAQEILSPVLNLMPDLQNFQVQDNPGICPTGDFTVFGTTHYIGEYCEFFEEHRNSIRLVMILVFTIYSMFIILRA